jgi:phosphoadenosine phosphosulfate reductase
MDTAIGNARLGEVYYMDRNTGEPVLKISGKKGKNKLKITVLKKSIRNVKITESLLKAQITKFQNCLACSGCASVCRFDALRVMNTNKGNVSTDSVSYTIDSDKCVGCLKCVNHFDGGCYMYKVLKTKKGQTA